MNKNFTSTPAEPQFVRERVAWYKAGANKMLTLAIIIVVFVDIIVAAISAWYEVGPYQTVVITIFLTLCALASASQWIEIQSRAAARRDKVSFEQY